MPIRAGGLQTLEYFRVVPPVLSSRDDEVVPVALEMREGFVLEVYDKGERGPDLVERRRYLWEAHPRAFAAVIRLPNGWEQHAVALWPSDILPPLLGEIDRGTVQRDAVQFVVPGVEECAVCGERIEGLTLAGRFWFGGNRRRHKLIDCPACGADRAHARLRLVAR